MRLLRLEKITCPLKFPVRDGDSFNRKGISRGLADWEDANEAPVYASNRVDKPRPSWRRYNSWHMASQAINIPVALDSSSVMKEFFKGNYRLT